MVSPFLKPLAVYGCIWLYLAVDGRIWPYVAVYGCIWLYMAVYDCIWPYMAVSGCTWLHLAVYYCLWLYLAVYCYLWLHMVIYGSKRSQNGPKKGAKMIPKWTQKTSQNDPRGRPGADSGFARVLRHFGVDFWFHFVTNFGIFFGTKTVPKDVRKTRSKTIANKVEKDFQKRPKTVAKTNQNSMNFRTCQNLEF